MRMMIAVLLVALWFASPPPDASPALAGIAHVAFRVRDVPNSRDFYRTLGFEESFAFADPGKPPVSYIKINDRQFIELYGRADDSQSEGLLHICYEAADITALWNEYAKRGINTPAPRKARAGNLLFAFHDPEGQLVEYTQYLPGSLHFEDRGKHLGDRRISQHLVRAVMAVQDPAAERQYFTSILAFEKINDSRAVRLRLPGNSGHEVELAATSPTTKPRIVLTVPDLARAAEELRSRAIAVNSSTGSISISDPDGAVIEFIQENSETRSKS